MLWLYSLCNFFREALSKWTYRFINHIGLVLGYFSGVGVILKFSAVDDKSYLFLFFDVSFYNDGYCLFVLFVVIVHLISVV